MTLDARALRWGQLTFSSFDDGVNPGGWQVKQTLGELSDAERLLMRSQITTTFDLVEPLPQFPTPDDIAALPHRLVYLADDGDRGLYLHTCFAGPDASGRPGNVFVHAVLDRTISSVEPPIRPVDFWRSPDWLTPYGADAVRHAVLRPGHHPGAAKAMDRGAILDFILDPAEWRVGTLSVLVDAVMQAMEGGPRVILAPRSVDTGALWIAAVSHCVSPAQARRLAFSTFERAKDIGAAWSKGVHLALVPRSDLARLDADESAVVIDTAQPITLGQGAVAHRTGAGQEVPVTDLSVLVEAVFQDRETAGELLTLADQISVQVGDGAMGPAWPLAAAMASKGDQFEDVRVHLDDALTTAPPAKLAAAPDTARLVEERLLARIGYDVSAAWAALTTAVGSSRAIVLESYLRLALRDEAWLSQPGGAPLPAHDDLAQFIDERLRSSFADRITQARALPSAVDRCVALVWLLDFGLRTTLTTPTTADPADVVATTVREFVVPTLMGPEGATACQALADLSTRRLIESIRDGVDAVLQTQPAQHPLVSALELPLPVLTMLGARTVNAFRVERLAQLRKQGRALSICASAYVIRAAQFDVDDGADKTERSIAALWLILDAEEHAPNPVFGEHLVRLPLLVPAPEVIHDFVEAFGTAVPPVLVLHGLGGEWTRETTDLAVAVDRVDILGKRWADESPFDVASVRLAAHRYRRAPSSRRTTVSQFESCRRVLELSPPLAVVQDCGSVFIAALVCIVLTDVFAQLDVSRQISGGQSAWLTGSAVKADSGRWDGGRTSAAADPRRPSPVNLGQADWDRARDLAQFASPKLCVEFVRAHMSAASLDTTAVVATAVAGSEDFPFAGWSFAQPPRELASLTTADGVPLVRYLLAGLLTHGSWDLDARQLERLAQRMGRAGAGRFWPEEADDFDVLLKFLRKRWKELSTGDDSKGLLRKWR